MWVYYKYGRIFFNLYLNKSALSAASLGLLRETELGPEE
jgi:hypothetical protein